MASDPGFIFYPGDYLRDTQCLSEKSQVAYDRIMCEHMRNICISQQQLKFFTKRLNEEETAELLMVLTQKPEGFFITWVVESIEKRRAYSDSRRKNRFGSESKSNEKYNNISKTYVTHMDNENEIVIDNEDVNSIMDFFNFNEVANFDKMRDISSFLKCLTYNKKIDYFKQQFPAYCRVKLADPKYKNQIKSFLGTAKELYEDGAWNAENWLAKSPEVNKPKFQF